MLSTSFKNEYSDNDITKISVLSESDSFIYAIFEHDLLQEAGRLPLEDLDDLCEKYEGKKIYFGSKSKTFSHVDEGNLSILKGQTKYQELLDTNPNVYCCYFDDNFNSISIQPQHFSSIIHHHFKYKSNHICYIHFNKKSIIICISGKEGFRFYNEFDFGSSEDALYYLLSVLDRTELNKENVEILAGGYIERNSEVFKLLYRYLDHFDLVNIEALQVMNADTNAHSYFDHYLNIHS
jgi:hypothetical protein